MHLGKRTHLHWIVNDECWLDELALAGLSEYLVDKLALAHGFVYLDTQFLCHLTDFILALALKVVTSLFLNCLKDRQAAVWSLETNEIAVDHALRFAVNGCTYGFEQLLCEVHHPIVILILNVKFHTSKLRVVSAVHTFVAEVLANLIYTLETAYYQSLKVKLCGDAHKHLLIESVEVCDEWAGGSTAGNRLECWCLNLSVSCLIEHAAYGADDCCTLQECVLDAIVYNQVNITLAVSQLRVVKFIVCHTILIFYDRQWLKAL